MIWGRQKLGAAAREIADHLQMIEQVRALQTAQKDIADAIGKLSDRIYRIEADLQTMKADIKLDALKEAQHVVYSVQSGLNDRIQEIAVKLALQERGGAVQPTSLPPPNS